MSPRTLPLLVFAAMASQVAADVTILHEFRLGDDDPGALAGELFNPTTIDSAGSADLNRKGSVFYSSDVPFPSLDGTTNAFSARFTGELPTELSASSSLLPFADNFGMELYVKILNRELYRSYPLVSDAGPLWDGFSLEVRRNQFTGLVGQSVGNWWSPSEDRWYHLALVRDQGVNRFYVDGWERGTSLLIPNPERTFFQIGGHSSMHAIGGLIDEVRLFTFEPGEFTTEDLLINQVPEPATAGLVAVGLMGLLTCMRRRRNRPRTPSLFRGSGSPTQILSRTLPAMVIAALSVASHAGVKPQAYYRLGDDDPGAVSGGLVNSTSTDSSGSRDLTRTGEVLYSSDVPFPIIAGQPNTFSAKFHDYFADLSFDSRLMQATDNFGLELFVKVLSTEMNFSSGLAYDGKARSTGFGLLRTGMQLQATLAPGTEPAVHFGHTDFVLNRWYHLALVRDEGVSTFYVNGVAVGTSTVTPAAGSLPFRIGSSIARDSLDGLVDEVRLFSFQGGTFRTQDLLINQVPEPATAGLLAVGLTTLLTRKSRRIQPRNPMQFPQGSRT